MKMRIYCSFISSPIFWSFTCLARKQMLGLRRPNKSIALTFLVYSSPFFTEFIYNFFTLYFSHWHLSLIAFASTSGSLSYSVMNFVLSLLILFKHSAGWSWLFDFYYRFRPTSISHPLLNKRRINALLVKNLLELLHAFIFLTRSSVSFECMLLSKSMFFLFDLLKGLLYLRFYKAQLIFLDFHPLHFH